MLQLAHASVCPGIHSSPVKNACLNVYLVAIQYEKELHDIEGDFEKYSRPHSFLLSER